MHTFTRSRRLWAAPFLVTLVAAGVLAAVTLAACGGSDDGVSPSSSVTPAASAAATDRPDFTSPSASPSPITVRPVDVKGDLLVVRGAKDDWAVWRVTPATGAEERLADLPFEPGASAASPDHRHVAYLKVGYPRPGWRRTLAIVDLAGEVVWPDHEGTGLRRVNDMSWLSPTELLVSGPVPKGGIPPEDDRLYVYDVAASEWESFHDIRGTEPSVAADSGEIVFRRLVTLEETASGPRVREELVRRDPGSGAVAAILSAEYVIYAAGNTYEQPTVSPDGQYVLAAETGSDTGVTWSLYLTDGGPRAWVRVCAMANTLLGAWDEDGRRLALWGVPARRWAKTTVWVYDVKTASFAKSLTKRDERVLEGLVTGLDWSGRGDLAASTSERPADTVFVAPGGDPKAFVALCAGSLPVWLD